MSLISELLQYPTQISHLTGASNYTWIHFKDGKKVLLSKPIQYFEEHLPQFLRIHKTALVNPQYITGWQSPPRRKMTGYVSLTSGTILPVSRRRWAQLTPAILKTNPGRNGGERIRNYRSIVLVTDNNARAALVQQSFEKQFPDCLVHGISRGSLLTESLRLLQDTELPILILLDARTSSADRISALRHLKTMPREASIPTLLLVPQSADELINQGYEGRANSVVTVPEGTNAFLHTVTQLGQFWLTTAALPIL